MTIRFNFQSDYGTLTVVGGREFHPRNGDGSLNTAVSMIAQLVAEQL